MAEPTEAEVAQLLANSSLISRTLEKLARTRPDYLNVDLVQVGEITAIADTKTQAHCYSVAIDANGRPRTSVLIERICEHIIDYAIPRNLIEEADRERALTGSSRKWVRLTREATALFTDLAKTGEGGEMLLFLLAESILRLPQVICKMSLKTSGRMHYHGADGVHADVDPATGLLSLYWGESKLHKTASSAISECLESLAPYLREIDSRDSTRRRDIKLLSQHVDLNDPLLEGAMKAYLDHDHPAFNKLKYCGLALVGFDADCYPPDSERAIAEEVIASAKKAARIWHRQVKNRVVQEKIEAFDIHFFCIPFPSVDAFRARFLSELGLGSDAAA